MFTSICDRYHPCIVINLDINSDDVKSNLKESVMICNNILKATPIKLLVHHTGVLLFKQNYTNNIIFNFLHPGNAAVLSGFFPLYFSYFESFKFIN